jgi:hypothetical protein
MRAPRPQPALEVSRAPAAVRGYDDLDTRGAGSGQQLADVLEVLGGRGTPTPTTSPRLACAFKPVIQR